MKKLLIVCIGIATLSSVMFAGSQDSNAEIGAVWVGPHYSNFRIRLINETNNSVKIGMVDAGHSGTFGFGENKECSKTPITLAPHSNIYHSINWKLNPAYKKDHNNMGFTLNGFKTTSGTPYYLSFTTYERGCSTKGIPTYWHTVNYSDYIKYDYPASYKINVNGMYIRVTQSQ